MSDFLPRFTITNAITRDLTAIERARGFLDAATLSDDWIRRMSQRALLLEAHHTTHIEGTRLTIEQSRCVWEGETVREADAEDVQELLNYRDAFQFVSNYLEGGGPITETMIREIHKRLVQRVRGEEGLPGVYRAVQNFVANSQTGEVIYTPPPPGDVPDLMRQLVGWLQIEAAIHPVLVAGIAQFQMVHIHPFVDGNGRTSRLLSTLCLYRAGYVFKRLFTLSEYYDRDRLAFYRAIQAVREQQLDLSGWLEFFVAGLATQLSEVKARGETTIRADVVARTQRLNERQSRLLQELLLTGSLDIQQCERLCAGVSRRTLQRDLTGLEDKQLVRRTGETNHVVYLPTLPDL